MFTPSRSMSSLSSSSSSSSSSSPVPSRSPTPPLPNASSSSSSSCTMLIRRTSSMNERMKAFVGLSSIPSTECLPDKIPLSNVMAILDRYHTLHDWLRANHEALILKSHIPSGASITHTTQTGHKLCIPDHAHDVFLRLLARDEESKRANNYISELVPSHDEVVALFFDLDLQSALQISESELQGYIVCIQKAVQTFFPNEPEDTNKFDVIVWMVPTMPKSVTVNAQLKQQEEAQKKKVARQRAAAITTHAEAEAAAAQEALQQTYGDDLLFLRENDEQFFSVFNSMCAAEKKRLEIMNQSRTDPTREPLSIHRPYKIGNSYYVWKVGLHPVFPNLRVRKTQCIWIREFVLCVLRVQYPEVNRTPYCNTWEERLDSAVYGYTDDGRQYRSGGIRLGCTKKMMACDNKPYCVVTKRQQLEKQQRERHDFLSNAVAGGMGPGHAYVMATCKDELRNMDEQEKQLQLWKAPEKKCNKCDNTGSIVVGRTYLPYLLYGRDGAIKVRTNDLIGNLYEALKLSYIRRPRGTLETPGFCPLDQAPIPTCLVPLLRHEEDADKFTILSDDDDDDDNGNNKDDDDDNDDDNLVVLSSSSSERQLVVGANNGSSSNSNRPTNLFSMSVADAAAESSASSSSLSRALIPASLFKKTTKKTKKKKKKHSYVVRVSGANGKAKFLALYNNLEADSKSLTEKYRNRKLVENYPPLLVQILEKEMRAYDPMYCYVELDNILRADLLKPSPPAPSSSSSSTYSSSASATRKGEDDEDDLPAKKIKVKSSTKNGTTKYRAIDLPTLILSVKGAGSKYCVRKGDKHNSSSVHFCLNLSRFTIRVKCKSKKALCKGWPGGEVRPVSAITQEALRCYIEGLQNGDAYSGFASLRDRLAAQVLAARLIQSRDRYTEQEECKSKLKDFELPSLFDEEKDDANGDGNDDDEVVITAATKKKTSSVASSSSDSKRREAEKKQKATEDAMQKKKLENAKLQLRLLQNQRLQKLSQYMYQLDQRLKQYRQEEKEASAQEWTHLLESRKKRKKKKTGGMNKIHEAEEEEQHTPPLSLGLVGGGGGGGGGVGIEDEQGKSSRKKRPRILDDGDNHDNREDDNTNKKAQESNTSTKRRLVRLCEKSSRTEYPHLLDHIDVSFDDFEQAGPGNGDGVVDFLAHRRQATENQFLAASEEEESRLAFAAAAAAAAAAASTRTTMAGKGKRSSTSSSSSGGVVVLQEQQSSFHEVVIPRLRTIREQLNDPSVGGAMGVSLTATSVTRVKAALSKAQARQATLSMNSKISTEYGDDD